MFIVFSAEALIGSTMHSLGLQPAGAIENTRFPAKLVADTICSTSCSIREVFPLRRIDQPVAMPTGKDCAAVEDRDTTTASKTAFYASSVLMRMSQKKPVISFLISTGDCQRRGDYRYLDGGG
jgi:hypothetical protein